MKRFLRGWVLESRNPDGPAPLKVTFGFQVAVFLILAVAVLAGVGWLLWDRLAAGNPSSLKDQLDMVKIALSIVAGIGGVVALTVAYRKQRIGEAAERREDTKLFNERFGACVDQLASNEPTIRLGGVYAIAGLADDWKDGRQRCIDVLCAYLRMPRAETAPPAATEEQEEQAGPSVARQQERQVQDTIWRVIGNHLRADPDTSPSWCGYNFDFTGAAIEGADLGGVQFTGGDVSFVGAEFIGGDVSFVGAKFTGSRVDFLAAKFTGSRVSFDEAEFIGGDVSFVGAEFTDGRVGFKMARFTGGKVSFGWARFIGGWMDFAGARFTGGDVSFNMARFIGGRVEFVVAGFIGGDVNFVGAGFIAGEVSFYGARFTGGTVDFDRAEFTGGRVEFAEAEFAGGAVDLSRPARCEVPPTFGSLYPLPPGLLLPGQATTPPPAAE